MKYSLKKLLCILMAFAVTAAYMPLSAHAEQKEAAEAPSEEISLEDTLQLEEVSRDKALLKESDEAVTVFRRDDGKKTAVFHGQNVRFRDESGKLKDYNPALKKVDREKSHSGRSLSKYAYMNTDGDSLQYFPERISEGTPLLMEKGEYSVSMYPEDMKPGKVEVSEHETVTAYEEIESIRNTASYAAEDGNTVYEYTSLDNGVKESIIISERPESSAFSFILDTGGLDAEAVRGSTEVVLKDGKETVSYIEAPFMNDATGRNYSDDIDVELERTEEGVYEYTMTLSEEYLDNAVYPVTVDPSHTWKGSSDLIDVYVVSGSTYGNTNFYSSDVKIMPAGIASDGHTYRTYMKLIDLKATIGESYVESAQLTLYERSGSAKSQTININRVLDNWTASSVTWNSKPSYSSTVAGTFKSSGTANTAHTVNLTSLVRGFVNGTYDHNYGISIRNATSSPSYVSFYGSRSTSSSYRPKLTVTYYDKPSRPESVSFESLSDGEYRETLYHKRGRNVYACWSGISSRGLSDIEYKVTAYDDSTPSPTHITGSSSSADLTKYRSLGVSSSSGSHVRLPYMQFLPEGKYKVYIRGTDAGGMHGPGKYKVLRIDGTAPHLEAALTPESSEASPASEKAPEIEWLAVDANLREVTVSVNGSEPDLMIASPYKIQRNLLQQGENHISVMAEDKAGNTSAENLIYWLDSEGPEITEFAADEETSDEHPSAERRPQVSWILGESAECTLYVDGREAYSDSANSGTFEIPESLLAETGRHKIRLTAEDRTGNLSEAMLDYWLDISAPEFIKAEISPESGILRPSKNLSPVVTWQIGEDCIESVAISCDGESWTEIGTDTEGGYTVPREIFTESGRYEFQLKAVDRAGNEALSAQLVYHADVTGGDAVPEFTDAFEYYGKRVLRWETEAPDADTYRYDIIRDGETVAEDIDVYAGRFADMDIIDAGSHVYRILLTDRISGQESGDYAEIQLTTATERASFSDRSGIRPYLGYFRAELPQENVYIEKSSGNILLSQSDFEVSNSELSYGLSRTYNGCSSILGMAGEGWSDSYHMELYRDGSDVVLVDSEGTVTVFTEDDGGYASQHTEYTLEEEEGNFILRDSDRTEYRFNSGGSLKSTVTENGNNVTNSYDADMRLTMVTSNRGRMESRSLELSYDGLLLQEITDFAGTEYSYGYSGNELTSFTAAGSGRERAENTYSYSSDGRMTGASDREGNEYSIAYDADGKTASITYPNGESYLLSYNEGSAEAEKRNESGRSIYTEETAFDSLGRVTCETDAAGYETDYSYDSEHIYLQDRSSYTVEEQRIGNDNTVSVTERNVYESTDYNESGHVTAETLEDGTVIVYTYSGEDIVREVESKGDTVISDYSYSYDESGNLIEETDNVMGTATMYAYNESGDMVSMHVLDTESGLVTSEASYTYDRQGNEDSSEVSEGTFIKSEGTAEYDRMGRMTAAVQDGIETVYSYDFLGRVISEVSSADGIVKSRTVSYTGNGYVASETVDGVISAYSYDQLGRLVSESRGSWSMSYSYGYAGNVSVSDGIESRTVPVCYMKTVSECGTPCETVYTDGAGREVKRTEGNLQTDYTYDVDGSMICEYSYEVRTARDAEPAESIILHLSADGSQATVVNPAVVSGGYTVDDSLSIATAESLDAKGNVTSETDEHGVETQMSYDSRSRITQVRAAGMQMMDITYSDEGYSTTATSTVAPGTESESISTVTTDAAGLDVTTVDGDRTESGPAVTRAYDERGNISRETFRDRSYTEYSYDAFSNITSKTSYTFERYENGQPVYTEEEQTVYSYDSTGRVSSSVKTDRNGDTVCEKHWSYDSLGRIAEERTAAAGETGTYVVGYTYTDRNWLASVSYGGRTYRYSYDDEGNVISVSEGNSLLSEMQYDSLGRMTERRDYDGDDCVIRTYSCDSLGRTVSMAYSFEGGSEFQRIEYEYDENNRIKKKTLTAAAGGTSSADTFDYTYDELGRLTRSRKNGSEVISEYSYDQAGNRVSETVNGEVTEFTYNSLNQLTGSTAPDGTSASYEYDPRGNLTGRSLTDDEDESELTEYEYSVSGELLSVEREGTVIQKNVYDENGQRIWTGTEADGKYYHYVNGRVAASGDTQYALNPDGEILGQYKGNDYSLLSSDIQGSTVCITDGTDVKTIYEYSDFGETAASNISGNVSTEIQYTGAVYDTATGMYYMNARYYVPETGRFISQDTCRGEEDDSSTWHLYAYCNNDPINYTDPSGHKRLRRPPDFDEYVWEKVKLYVSWIPSKKVHFGRNSKNTGLPISKTDASNKKWTELAYSQSICHQFGCSRKNANLKFVSQDGHKEVVFNHKGNKIVTDARNLGTYNFESPQNKKGHLFKDLIPWVAWGNNFADVTTVPQRVDVLAFHVPSSLLFLSNRRLLRCLAYELRRNG